MYEKYGAYFYSHHSSAEARMRGREPKHRNWNGTHAQYLDAGALQSHDRTTTTGTTPELKNSIFVAMQSVERLLDHVCASEYVPATSYLHFRDVTSSLKKVCNISCSLMISFVSLSQWESIFGSLVAAIIAYTWFHWKFRGIQVFLDYFGEIESLSNTRKFILGAFSSVFMISDLWY